MAITMTKLLNEVYIQKQPPEEFCKKVNSATLLKYTPAQVFSCEIYEIFKNTYFEEHLRTTASVYFADKNLRVILGYI